MRYEKTGMEWVEAHDQFIGKLMERNMQEYEVVITGSFRKTITVSAINEDEAAMAVEDHPWNLEYEDIVDYEIEDVYVD
jgi:exosome complex RNA-binding protein Rrp4